MFRKLEYKYLVRKEFIDSIRSDMDAFVRLDPYADNGNNGQYTVRSIYFDTSRKDCYCQKIEGIKVRKKYRIRGYNNLQKQNLAFLEVKKKYINFVKKNRAAVLHKNLNHLFISSRPEKYLISSGNNERSVDSAQRFLYHYHRYGLNPTVLIAYDREAFFSKFDKSLRITFDKNLRSVANPTMDMLYNDNNFKYVFRNNFILEVKFFGTMPAWLLSLIRHYQLTRMALSKYTNCVDSSCCGTNKLSGVLSSFQKFELSEFKQKADL